MPSESTVERTAAPPAPARAGFWTAVAPWMGIVLIAGGLLALRPPAALSAVVLLGAVGAVTERLVRHRRRGLLDAVLVGTGAVGSATGLLAFGLAASPIGLGPGALLVGLGAVGLAALAMCIRRPVPPSPVAAYLAAVRPVIGTGTVAVVLAAVLLVGGALTLSVISTDAHQVAPLAFSARPDGAAGGRLATVEVTAGEPTGPLTVQTVVDDRLVVIADGIRVGPDQPFQVTVALTPGARTTVQLVPAGSADPVRELVLGTPSSSGGS